PSSCPSSSSSGPSWHHAEPAVSLQKYPQPKGQKKKKIVKYGMGGLIILFLVAIIWFPLLFMSLVRSVVGVVNHPIDVTVTLKLGGYEPLFTMSAQQQSIQPFTPQDYEALTNEFERQPVAMQFITLYSYKDIVTARIEGSSGSLWSISPPSREQMRRELQNGSSDITLRLTWTFQRDLGKGGTVEHTFDKHTTDLQPGAPERAELAELLQGTRNTPVQVPKLFPKYIRAPNGPEANPVKQLLPDGEDSYLDVEVQLKRERVGSGRSSDSFLEWWVVRLKDAPLRDGNILPMVIFNDKDHGALRLHRAGDREVRARLLQRDLALHHVRGAALRGPHPQAVPGHLPGAGDGRAGAGGGALRQAHLPLPLARDHDQVDAGEGVRGRGTGQCRSRRAPRPPAPALPRSPSQGHHRQCLKPAASRESWGAARRGPRATACPHGCGMETPAPSGAAGCGPARSACGGARTLAFKEAIFLKHCFRAVRPAFPPAPHWDGSARAPAPWRPHRAFLAGAAASPGPLGTPGCWESGGVPRASPVPAEPPPQPRATTRLNSKQ
uniref:Piezo non-specific cation channel R-Ras-binding domain-containing protein n=1 Tax=Apteryx owenii TaxID=8824 RepID=A0A8B9Q8Q4_APTOW